MGIIMMQGWLSSHSPFTSRNHGTTKGAKQERSGEVSVATLFLLLMPNATTPMFDQLIV